MKLSHSALERYKLCPKSYQYHYVMGYRDIMVGSPLVYGNILGKVFAQQVLSKKVNLTDEEKGLLNKIPAEYFDELCQTYELNGEKISLPTSELIHYHKGDYQEEILTDTDLELIANYRKSHGFNNVGFEDLYSYYKAAQADKDEIGFMNFMFYVSMRRKCLYMIESYQVNIVPRIVKVHSLEEPISIKNCAGDEIVGFIDLDADIALDDGTVVRAILDNKTSSAKYNVKKFVESGQLHLYNYLKELEYIGYLVIVKKIKVPKIGKKKGETFAESQILVQANCPELEEGFIKNADEILELIKSEMFPKNTSSCLAFGQRCPFYNLCQGDGNSNGLIKKET